MESTLINILIDIWIGAAILMLLTWLIQVRTNDASYVDVVWAAGIGLATVYCFFIFTEINLRTCLIFLCPLFWSYRLSYYLIKRLIKLGHEDSRYQTMRTSFGGYANLVFLIFFQVQALFILIFATPVVIALLSPDNILSINDIVGLLIFITALLGEAIADKQLLKHKIEHGNNITCQTGLWYYSRHPNYFFEWMHWFSYALFSISSSYFYITLMMPFIMLFFIIYVTGVPHVEREALKKKPDYDDYIKTTPMLIPNIFKK